jgi:hypothetical protein
MLLSIRLLSDLQLLHKMYIGEHKLFMTIITAAEHKLFPVVWLQKSG